MRGPAGLGQDRAGAGAAHTAAAEDAATERFMEFVDTWCRQYPATVKLQSEAWAELVPFLAFDVETRRVICSTDEMVKCRHGIVRLPVVDEDFVRAFSLLRRCGLNSSPLLVVVGGARGAEVSAP